MTTIPKFPTPSKISEQVANIAPTRGRYQEIQRSLRDAIDLAPTPASPLDTLTASAIATGAMPTPEALLDAAQATLTQDRDTLYMRGILDSAYRRYLTAPSEPTTEQSAEILQYLSNTALPAVVAAVKALPKDVPLTAEDALDHGSETGAELYRTARALVAAYDAIRSQQRAAIKRIASSAITSTDWPTMIARSGIAKDASEWESQWIQERTTEGEQYGNGLKQRAEQTGEDAALKFFVTDVPEKTWPVIPERATWPENTDDDETRARWLIRATRHLELWVPSFDELTEADTENRARCAVTSWVNGRTQRSTRIDHFGRKRVTETEIVAGVRGQSRTTTTR